MRLAALGRKRSAASIEKTRQANIGRKPSPEARQKMSLARRGKKHPPEFGEKVSKALTGRKFSKEHRQNLSKALMGNRRALGLKHSEETKNKIRLTKLGEKNYCWKGGVSSINARIRRSYEYRNWRKAVFERDDYTCVNCQNRGIRLNADHIKPFAKYPEFRFDINNGRTLCVPCHKKTDTFGRPKTQKRGQGQ
jgi:5-methylcytosine-specific restriction endonuclease McrA